MPGLLASYDCAEPETNDGGFVRVAIRPRESGRHLVNGTLLWEPSNPVAAPSTLAGSRGRE